MVGSSEAVYVVEPSEQDPDQSNNRSKAPRVVSSDSYRQTLLARLLEVYLCVTLHWRPDTFTPFLLASPLFLSFCLRDRKACHHPAFAFFLA
jgi:hypothetical protein